MSVRKGVARGVMVLGVGQGAAQALSMVKNIVVARLLGPEDWGIAATFWVALTLLDAVSTLATDRQVVQAEDGGEAGFLGTAHVLQALRGIVTGVMVFGLSWVAAWAFKTPQVLWAYQMIALVPVIRGFSHLGMFVQQREMRFGATVRVDVWTQLVALAVGAPLAWMMGSYAAALWMILGQTIAACVLSHVVGGARYRWSWNSALAARMWRFGLPLMANGLLMFVILQGDQGVIGVAYSKETLGLYAAAFGLASIPTMLVGKVASSAFLPPLSRAQGDAAAFERRVGGCVESLALVAGGVGVGMVLLGPWAMTLLYGSSFAAAGEVVGLLGVMFAIRIARIGPTLAAMARGDTVNALVGNLWRMIALGGVMVAAWMGAEVWWIALAGVVGELFALSASTVRLRRRQGVGMRASVGASVLALAACGMALALDGWFDGLSVGMGAVAGCVIGAVMIGAMVVMFPRVGEELRAVSGLAFDAVRRRRGGAGA